jgi:DNA-binding NtrC family response regulator
MSSRILIADDDAPMRDSCRSALEREGMAVAEATNGAEALQAVSEDGFDLVILDLKMPGTGGMEVLRQIQEQNPDTSVVVITGYATVDTAVEAMKCGAVDFLPKPFNRETLRVIVEKALKQNHLRRENKRLRRELGRMSDGAKIVGRTPQMERVFKLIEQVAPTDSTVLISGESGTGKELVARALHAHSRRAQEPFVVVDCATLVGTLFENELFGHAKGSFTGATSTTHGRFELADGGTLFLDEVSCIEAGMQQKLLRVLEEREFARIGSNETIAVDVRVIAATNTDLAAAVDDEKFREDLYYRLNVFPIDLPPLRDRKPDIPLLVEHFVRLHAQAREKQVTAVDEKAMEELMQHRWPGNVRELSNVIERAVVLAEDGHIGPQHLLYGRTSPTGSDGAALRTLAELEKQHIYRVLRHTDGNKKEAAEKLGIDRKTLYRKLRRYEEEQN